MEENIDIFLELADTYHLEPLKRQTEKAAIQQMTVDDMVYMHILANLYRAEKLKAASEFLIKTNKENLKEQDLSEYSADEIIDILKLIC